MAFSAERVKGKGFSRTHTHRHADTRRAVAGKVLARVINNRLGLSLLPRC